MKLIINCDPTDFDLALKCAQWLIERPEHREVVTAFNGGKDFYTCRRKACISVKDITQQRVLFCTDCGATLPSHRASCSRLPK